MADMLTFELVSPERLLASMEAESVTIPGMLGELTAMANHAPFLTTLRPGYVSVNGGSAGRYFVTGGFAEISDNTVSVLAEEAIEADGVDDQFLSDRLAAAERAHEDAGDDRKQATRQTVMDYQALTGQS